MNDLSEIKGGNYLTFKSSSGTKAVILNESDPLWTKFRHVHIAEVTQQLADGFKEFLSQDFAAQREKQGMQVSGKILALVFQI